MDDNNDNSLPSATNDELNGLRSILRSDDCLQMQSSGDYELVRIKLDNNIQIQFLFDSLNQSSIPLTIHNVCDLRLVKSSNTSSLNKDQWTELQNHFNQIIQQSNDAPIRDIVQAIQDRLMLITTTNGSRYKPKKSTRTTGKAESSSAASKFRGADLIFNRLLHDKTIDRTQVIIVYEDRFTGLHEIAFNEFKKVHDDEFGVPMHRIRQYKINGKIVWDRTKRLDILTGSGQQSEAAENLVESDGIPLKLTQGMYRFDRSTHQWLPCPCVPLTTDDSTTPSSADMFLPNHCQFLTWNILFDYHHSALIYTSQRYRAILDTLKSLLPDIVCLQEVTIKFLNYLLDETWLGEHNYYLIFMQNVLDSTAQQSYGQIMLLKNIRPRSLGFLPLITTDESTSTAQRKEILVARFGLNAKTTIDLVNLHLNSNRSRNADEKRCRSLENLFINMNTRNYMLIGDFNFGDYDEKEQTILERYRHDIHDLWKDIYDLDENPGFTYDPSRNLCARITSDTQIKRRFDRYLLHTLPTVNYSIEHLNMVGLETVRIDDDDKRVNQSDHYALQLLIQFRLRSISHRSALVLLPTMDTWPSIQPFREQYDPSFVRWPPHINLIWPFFDLTDSDDDEESLLLPLRLLLAQEQSFDVRIDEIDTFPENNVIFMKLNSESTRSVERLHEHVKRLFPQCTIQNRNGYTPHLTIAQFGNEEKQNPTNKIKPTLTLSEPVQFTVRYLYILRRPHDNDTEPFHIAYQLPLGPILEPLSLSQSNCVDTRLQEFFNQTNLYETEDSYQRKRDKLDRLGYCFAQIFNENTLHCFTHAFLPYGSFRIGLHGHDLDTVFVLSEKTNSLENGTNFDSTLVELRGNPSALNDYIVTLIESQIRADFNDQILVCRKIQALFPIISILFNDQTRVEIFVEIKMKNNNDHHQQQQQSNLLANFHEPVHGVHDMERLLAYVRSPSIFQHLLTFVRAWAQHVGLYGQVYGYLGGYSWAVLCACICHSSLSPIISLDSLEHFSLDQFFTLVINFFSIYAQTNWSSEIIRLHSTQRKYFSQQSQSLVHTRGSMRILCPSPPYNNTARSTTNATRDLIVRGFQRVVKLLKTMNTVSSEDKLRVLTQILQLDNEFPSQEIRAMLQLTLSARSASELDEWLGWMKSRLARLMNDCEDECGLFVQTQTHIDYNSQTKTEATYSIGFQLDEKSLSSHRQFYHCLNMFIDQFKVCSVRTDTMQFSYKLMSIHDWKLARMQPKPQRTPK